MHDFNSFHQNKFGGPTALIRNQPTQRLKHTWNWFEVRSVTSTWKPVLGTCQFSDPIPYFIGAYLRFFPGKMRMQYVFSSHSR